jgi:hypothetical protein
VPVHFWPVAVLSLLWNAFGGYDYAMSRSRSIDYLNQATQGHADIFLRWMDALPVWNQIAWPIGVWGSVLGSLLLLIRSRHAATAFLVSLAGAVISFGSEYAAGFPAELDTAAMKVMTVVILAAIVLFWWYSRRMQASGVLR